MDEKEVQDCYAKVGEQVGEGREMICRPGMIVALAAAGKGGGFSSASKTAVVVGEKKKRKPRSSKDIKTEVSVDETPEESVVLLKKQKTTIHNAAGGSKRSRLVIKAKNTQDPEDLVDHIVQHTGNNNSLDKMKFLVRWSGYGAADDTWQNYESMKDTAAYQSYKKSNGNFKSQKKRTHQSSDDESDEWQEKPSNNKKRIKSTGPTKKVTAYATQQRNLKDASAGINAALDNILAKKGNPLVGKKY